VLYANVHPRMKAPGGRNGYHSLPSASNTGR
jgi:hypothetical protein